MNIELAAFVLQKLFNQGIQEFCICAGARNSPLVYLLEQAEGVKLYHFFEERSAAFFALGRIQSQQNPVAVVTTSGTAVAELLPATIESYYTQKPLVLLTADRPPQYRGSGAPQSIEQVGIFSHYVESTWDIDSIHCNLDFSNWSQQKPIHLNVCFAEPLIDAEVPVLNFQKKIIPNKTFQHNLSDSLEDFLKTNTKTVVIVSALNSIQQAEVLRFLKKSGLPVYAEATSGLREHPELQDQLLFASDRMLQQGFQNQHFDSVLAIGGVPTLRFWRDLEENYKDVPTYVLNSTAWTGLARKVLHGSFGQLSNLESIQSSLQTKEIFKNDQAMQQKIEGLFEKYPLSEPSFFRNISQQSVHESVYLGNSLPIREWDLAAQTKKTYRSLMANRGANGIDGQISSFLGWSEGDINLHGLQQDYWCVVGDLTALYDLVSLWVSPQLKNKNIRRRIVVINNRGGQIFQRIFKKDIFINEHQLEFEKWAQMFSWEYQKATELNCFDVSAQNIIIEVQPNAEQTHHFWNEYDLLWQKK